jgi:putative transposase
MTTLTERQQIVSLVAEATAAGARQPAACAVLGFSERTLQRWQTPAGVGADQRPLRQWEPPNKLSEDERAAVLQAANSAEFGQLPPSQIVPRLADRGEYLASEATFYRILKAEHQLTHRRAERPATRSKPKAVSATAPNQVYSWDITYLPAAIRGQFFYLYLFLDLFSRKIVGWQVYDTECSVRASALLQDICQREAIAPQQVVLHSDNGGPMKGATMLATLQSLGVMPSFSRPAVSNDNPYSESLFKTLKYRPDYPAKPFADLAAARVWVDGFVRWYNHEHRHSAICFVTPAQRHAGLDAALLQQRKGVYEAAKAKHPQRWRGPIRNWDRVPVVHLNPNRSGTLTNESWEVNTDIKQTSLH